MAVIHLGGGMAFILEEEALWKEYISLNMDVLTNEGFIVTMGMGIDVLPMCVKEWWGWSYLRSMDWVWFWI
jgi:hypothetical protein